MYLTTVGDQKTQELCLPPENTLSLSKIVNFFIIQTLDFMVTMGQLNICYDKAQSILGTTLVEIVSLLKIRHISM